MTRSLLILIAWVIAQSSSYAQDDESLWLSNQDLRVINYDGGELITLWRNEETARKLGTALLLPDWGRLPTAPEAITPLREQLPGLNWETIALLPPIPEQGISLINGAELSEAARTYQASLVSALKSIEQAKNEQFGYRLVIAQGVMAGWILNIYQQQLYELPDALILIGSYIPELTRNQNIAQQIAEFPKPVLDISFTSNNRWVQVGAPLRQIAASKQQKLNYRQLAFTGDPYRAETGVQLTKSIYGWLTSIGWY